MFLWKVVLIKTLHVDSDVGWWQIEINSFFSRTATHPRADSRIKQKDNLIALLNHKSLLLIIKSLSSFLVQRHNLQDLYPDTFYMIAHEFERGLAMNIVHRQYCVSSLASLQSCRQHFQIQIDWNGWLIGWWLALTHQRIYYTNIAQ